MVTVTGRNFHDYGDVKCAFGDDEVAAIVINTTTIECGSPGCASPTCVTGQHETFVDVALEVSLNGVTFTGLGLIFTYLDMGHTFVSHLSPIGGPRAGSTFVSVYGYSFYDKSSGVMGYDRRGLKCKFGANALVDAYRSGPISGPSFSVAKCTAPTDLEWPNASALALHPMPLELTFNSYETAGSLTSSAVPFAYYNDDVFHVRRVFPLGGPMAGGTELSVYLTDERLLTDLGGSGSSGILCRFSHERVVGEFAHAKTVTARHTVNATLGDCDGGRRCGAGWKKITCVTPELTHSVDDPLGGPLNPHFDGRDVRVDVSINGQHFTRDDVHYRYYDPKVWWMHKVRPRGGPLSGNTTMNISGFRFQSLGDVRCRFGVLNQEVNATLLSDSRLACVSPPHWHQSREEQSVEFAITLNGQDYLGAHVHQTSFTYYAMGVAPSGVTVNRLDPRGGPARGGTLITVRGTGFRDRGGDDINGFKCLFSGEPAVEASLINREKLMCVSPPRTVAADSDGPLPTAVVDANGTTFKSFDGRAVEIVINHQLHAATSSGIGFEYYPQDGLAVSRVFPRAGPTKGGTAVTVWGAGFRDLGHGAHADGYAGLHCRFGPYDLVPATLLSAGGEGPQSLTCRSPPMPPKERPETLVVRVTNNHNNPPDGGIAQTDDHVGFTYYDTWEGYTGYETRIDPEGLPPQPTDPEHLTSPDEYPDKFPCGANGDSEACLTGL